MLERAGGHLPFRIPLKRTPYKPHLFTPTGHDHLIVRVNDPGNVRNWEVLWRDGVPGYVRLQELRDHFGVPLPAFTLVLGEDGNSGEARIFTVTEVINGKNLHDVRFGRKEIRRAAIVLDQLYDNLTRYLTRAFISRGAWLRDPFCGNGQYVYGRHRNDCESRVYLVDLDYHVGELRGNPENGLPCWEVYYRDVGSIADMMRASEAKLDGFMCSNAHKSLASLIAILPDDVPAGHLVKHLRRP